MALGDNHNNNTCSWVSHCCGVSYNDVTQCMSGSCPTRNTLLEEETASRLARGACKEGPQTSTKTSRISGANLTYTNSHKQGQNRPPLPLAVVRNGVPTPLLGALEGTLLAFCLTGMKQIRLSKSSEKSENQPFETALGSIGWRSSISLSQQQRSGEYPAWLRMGREIV